MSQNLHGFSSLVLLSIEKQTFFFLICNSCSVNPEQYYIGEEKFDSQYEVILLKLDFLHGGNQEFSVLYIFIHHVSFIRKGKHHLFIKAPSDSCPHS